MAEIKDSKLIRDALGSPVPQYWDETSQMYIARTVDGSFADVDFGKVRLLRDKLGSPIPQLWDIETARFVPGNGGGNGDVTIESVPGLKEKLDTTTAQLAETGKKNQKQGVNLASYVLPTASATEQATAFAKAISDLPAKGGEVIIPFDLTFDGVTISLDKSVILRGFGSGRVVADAGTTINLINGAKIIVNKAATITKLNFDGKTTGDGIHIRAGTTILDDVLVVYMLNDGIKIGDETVVYNANGTKLYNVKSRFNGRHGLKITAPIGSWPDSNAAGVYGGVFSANGQNGVNITNAIDNHFYNLTMEGNGDYALRLEDKAEGNIFIAPYMEDNGDTGVKSLYGGSLAINNMVVGHRSYSGIDDYQFTNAQNMTWGKDSVLGLFPVFKQAAFRKLRISNPSPSAAEGKVGYWEFEMDPLTRALSLGVKAGAAAVFKFLHDLEIVGQTQLGVKGARFNSGKAIRNIFYTSDTAAGTITIPPNSFVKSEKVLAGINTTDTYSMNSQVPDGVIASAKVVQGKVVFYYHNMTTTEKTFLVDSTVTIFKTEHA